MSSDDLSESGSEYLPGPSDEEESSDSDASDGEYDVSDELLLEIESVEEEAWRFMSDPFSDVHLDPLPLFTMLMKIEVFQLI